MVKDPAADFVLRTFALDDLADTQRRDRVAEFDTLVMSAQFEGCANECIDREGVDLDSDLTVAERLERLFAQLEIRGLRHFRWSIDQGDTLIGGVSHEGLAVGG